jgi:dTDP-4-dehydrorhamnose reductase
MSASSTKRALITGGAGLIGEHLIGAAARCAPGWEVLAPFRRELDLTHFKGVTAWFEKERPDLVIHCAALSRVSACEANPHLARRVNVDLTRHLATLAAGVPFVFFSSDLVFDGAKGGYTEQDAVAPLHVYGRTKADAEEIVRKHARHLIIRTSINYGHSRTGQRSFNEEILQAWREGRPLTLFTDEFRSPLAAELTARAVWELADKGASGVFHVAGTERLSRWDIGQLLLQRHPEYRELARPGSFRDFQGPPRAADTSLDCARAQALLSFALPKFSEWITKEYANPQTPGSQ